MIRNYSSVVRDLSGKVLMKTHAVPETRNLGQLLARQALNPSTMSQASKH